MSKNNTADASISTGWVAWIKKELRTNYQLYIMIAPVLLYYILFHYKPLYGIIIAFQDFNPRIGVAGSPWVGFSQFIDFLTDPYFGRILRNTLIISVSTLVFGFPAPIILALLINEMRGKIYKKTVQTLTYLPHFISLVVICGMIKDFTQENGVITMMLSRFGMPQKNMLNDPALFVPIYVISDIWQSVGWGSIIYLAALMGVDQELYEAAKIDGANRWKQTMHVTIPCIIPTITVMLILRIGNIINVGYEKIILLENPAIRDASDVISTYVYRRGLLDKNFSYSTAVGLFNSIINFALVILANRFSRKVNETSLW